MFWAIFDQVSTLVIIGYHFTHQPICTPSKFLKLHVTVSSKKCYGQQAKMLRTDFGYHDCWGWTFLSQTNFSDVKIS